MDSLKTRMKEDGKREDVAQRTVARLKFKDRRDKHWGAEDLRYRGANQSLRSDEGERVGGVWVVETDRQTDASERRDATSSPASTRKPRRGRRVSRPRPDLNIRVRRPYATQSNADGLFSWTLSTTATSPRCLHHRRPLERRRPLQNMHLWSPFKFKTLPNTLQQVRLIINFPTILGQLKSCIPLNLPLPTFETYEFLHANFSILMHTTHQP